MCGAMEKVLDADSNEPYLASIKERGGEGGGEASETGNPKEARDPSFMTCDDVCIALLSSC